MLFSLCLSSRAHADSIPEPHRLGLDVAPLTYGSYDSHEAYDTRVTGFALAAGYAYRAGRHVEIGAALGVTRVDGGALWLWSPQATLRLFLPLASDRLELGAGVRLGGLLDRLDTRVVTGTLVGAVGSVGLDARYWVSPRVALSLTVASEVGIAKAIGTPGGHLPRQLGDGPGDRPSVPGWSAGLLSLRGG